MNKITLTREIILNEKSRNSRLTKAELSRIYGVSRQHVHSLCKKFDITLYDGRLKGFAAPNRVQPCAVITGGVQHAVSNVVSGTIAEHLVVADLLARGLKPYMPVMYSRCHDIIAVDAQGVCHSFEVRNGHRDKNGNVKYKKSPDDKSDFYAAVVKGEPVTYYPEKSFSKLFCKLR